jgi:hypothetical protein
LRPSEKCWEYFFEDSEPGGFKDFLPAILFQFRPVMTLRNKGSLASSQGFVAAAPASRTFEPLVRESVAGTCHPLFCTSEIRVKQNIQKHIDTCLQQKTTLHANMKFVSEQTLRRKTDRSGTSSQVGWLKIIHNHQTCCCALSPSSCVCWTSRYFWWNRHFYWPKISLAQVACVPRGDQQATVSAIKSHLW